ncbi:MAG: RluA family pseudouridine synthase [Solirubrobacterales bacterium]|nr:RluA family pseudouridine synthase [Solirubrobacterales bacterium]
MPPNLLIDVPASAEGKRLDQFLAEPLGSRARAQRLIDDDQVLVDGVSRNKRHLLVGGESIEVDEHDGRAISQTGDADYSIVWEDEHLLVVDKPAGVVVHPAPGAWSGTLSQALAGRGAAGGADPERPGIVHRLDRNTSGLLVVARSEEAHRVLAKEMAARRISRRYLALVDGTPSSRTGTIDAPIGRDSRIRTRQSTDSDRPRAAVTHFEIQERLARSSLLEVTLETGRTHQIRVHLRAIGNPVLGDPEYGITDRYGLERQFLHAAHLGFKHPLTGDRIEVDAPLPKELSSALELARAER